MVATITSLFMLAVAAFCAFNYRSALKRIDYLTKRNANLQAFLDAAEYTEACDSVALDAAYKKIDRLEDKLHDKDFAAEVEEILQCCESEPCEEDALNCGYAYDDYGNLRLDKISWTEQDVTYSESDDSDV